MLITHSSHTSRIVSIRSKLHFLVLKLLKFSCTQKLESILMTVKLFILGFPGSGKSTTFRHVRHYLTQQQNGWLAVRVNDYDILKEIFQADTEHRIFRPTEHDGFDIIDNSVFDDALQVARERVKGLISNALDQLVVIEFSRNDYRKALEHFGADLLQNSYLLFLEVDEAKCRNRLKARITDPPTPDNHFVSEFILESYYKDTLPYTPLDLKADYGIDEQNILVIDNNGDIADLYAKVEQFVLTILERE